MWIHYALGIGMGAALGAWMGAARSCETGACPLTSSPYGGALYGALLGFMFVSLFFDNAPRPLEKSAAGSNNEKSAVASVTNHQEFEQMVLKSEVPVLVDFWASWCGPCRQQMPIVETLAGQVGDKARVVKINVDEAAELAEKMGVSSIPTLMVFKNGKETSRLVGMQSADVLNRALGV